MKNFKLILSGLSAFATMITVNPSFGEVESKTYYGIQIEEAEARFGDEGERLFVWNGDAYYGTDELKLRFLSGGEADTDTGLLEKLESQLVLQTPISDFFDAKAGVRADTPEGTDRIYGVIGISGLAPQWIEVDADFFVSETGDTSARLDLEYELLLTNELILTSAADINFAFSEDTEIGIGSGLSSAEAGLRLSYDLLDRSISPYIGVSYERQYGDTKDYAIEDGEDAEAWAFLIGSKFSY